MSQQKDKINMPDVMPEIMKWIKFCHDKVAHSSITINTKGQLIQYEPTASAILKVLGKIICDNKFGQFMGCLHHSYYNDQAGYLAVESAAASSSSKNSIV